MKTDMKKKYLYELATTCIREDLKKDFIFFLKINKVELPEKLKSFFKKTIAISNIKFIRECPFYDLLGFYQYGLLNYDLSEAKTDELLNTFLVDDYNFHFIFFRIYKSVAIDVLEEYWLDFEDFISRKNQ